MTGNVTEVRVRNGALTGPRASQISLGVGHAPQCIVVHENNVAIHW